MIGRSPRFVSLAVRLAAVMGLCLAAASITAPQAEGASPTVNEPLRGLLTGSDLKYDVINEDSVKLRYEADNVDEVEVLVNMYDSDFVKNTIVVMTYIGTLDKDRGLEDCEAVLETNFDLDYTKIAITEDEGDMKVVALYELNPKETSASWFRKVCDHHAKLNDELQAILD